MPAWSPDGRWIAFTRKRAHSQAEDLWLIHPDGSGKHLSRRDASGRRLTSARGDDTDASWSPDGRRILFDSTRDGNREVYVMNADGSGARNLTHNPAEDWADTWR